MGTDAGPVDFRPIARSARLNSRSVVSGTIDRWAIMASAGISRRGTGRGAGPIDFRPMVGPAGLNPRSVVSGTIDPRAIMASAGIYYGGTGRRDGPMVRTEMVGPVLWLHGRSCHGAAIVGADVMAPVIGCRSPRGNVVIGPDQVDGINGAAERVIGIDGPAAVIPVNGIAGIVIHVGNAGTAAAVGARYAKIVVVRIIAAGQGAAYGRRQHGIFQKVICFQDVKFFQGLSPFT